MDIIDVVIGTLIMVGVAGLIAFLLAVADKYLSVYVDPRIEKVTELLPGVNCGACGYAGCAGLAEALVNGKTTNNSCRPAKVAAKESIKTYLATTPDAEGNTLATTY
jgi:electron transport complex protein RnfB